MEEFTLPALVIYETDLGEQDKLLTLLCGQRGKLTAKVHGCRNIKSKNMASCSLFCYGSFTLSEKNGRISVKETSLTESFFALRSDIERLALANYITEVLLKVTTEGNDESELLSLGLNSLYAICQEHKSLTLIKAVFELRALSILGFMPDLSGCAECHTETEENLWFDLQEGTLICADCRQIDLRQTPMLSIPTDTLSAMRYILTAPAKRIFSFSLSENALQRLSDICERFLIIQTETNYKTLKFYHSIL